MKHLNIERLALLGALIGLFGELHPALDQWAQNSNDASCKGLYGDHLVYRDGTPVGQETEDRTGEPTMTATELGRLSVARHVASLGAARVERPGKLMTAQLSDVPHWVVSARQVSRTVPAIACVAQMGAAR
ncbi:hypothetical protein P3T27_006629 [Kitasatospora sp. MAA19]|uniref:hypothetical protein n=1 Tax=Kitasatospora sp. MAA19 TaxID=3035090 RepID=UPI0024766B2E|nr:hypothetical protein [Kitasatospora sp. MAA19]MDH6709880.1 hypothetical protein [Kitasatospora sp. MAA19]